MRRILRSAAVQAVAAWVLATYIRLVCWTTRWDDRRMDVARAGPHKGKPLIVVFWHGRMFCMPMVTDKKRRVHVLISHHRDGRLISRTIRHLHLLTVAGSSSRGSLGAVRALRDCLEANEVVAITPDGPRGPRMRAQKGAVALASATGAPILPFSFSVARGRNAKSWDRFLLPRMFGRGVIIGGPLIEVPPDADDAQLEASRLEVEEALNRLTREADLACGREPVEPEDPSVNRHAKRRAKA